MSLSKTKSEIRPFIHQRQIMAAPFVCPNVSYFALAGGYGCGKSFSIVLLILEICKKYQGEEISVALCSTTITLLRKTVLSDLERILSKTQSVYTYNRVDGILTIGSIKFLCIATGQPKDIYGPNVNITLCDEIDELPESKALEAHKALSERTRILLPDGRVPFVVYFSTVHGYRGLYKIWRQWESTKTPYVLVRGLTKNNIELSPSYVQNLYNIYTEQERLAYLEGMFVNLHSGRVYADYDEDINRVDEIIPNENETIYIGQDLNSGFSKAVALIKRDKKISIVHTWSFTELGGAPAIMRAKYPQSRILWYPDAAGKEIIKGYRAEILEAGIECRIGLANPRIAERVFYVNKLFKMKRLDISTSRYCDSLSEALKVRAYTDDGIPEKGKGENAPDHICDALEYAIYRIIKSDPDFFDLTSLEPQFAKEQGYLKIDGRTARWKS